MSFAEYRRQQGVPNLMNLNLVAGALALGTTAVAMLVVLAADLAADLVADLVAAFIGG
jgi:hypothetical protein